MTLEELRRWYTMTEELGVSVTAIDVSHADFARILVELGSRALFEKHNRDAAPLNLTQALAAEKKLSRDCPLTDAVMFVHNLSTRCIKDHLHKHFLAECFKAGYRTVEVKQTGFVRVSPQRYTRFLEAGPRKGQPSMRRTSAALHGIAEAFGGYVYLYRNSEFHYSMLTYKGLRPGTYKKP